MPRTIDSMIDNANAARALREAGRSVWTYKVNIPLDDDLTLARRRSVFAKGLEASRWFRETAADPDSELWQLWDEIKDADSIEHFNACLDALYDVADDDRCWLTLR